MGAMRVYARWLWAEVRWLAETVGYWIRPYDMLADGGRSDLVRVKLSGGHAWMPQAAVDTFGEDGLRRILGVDHIHPVPAEQDRDDQ